ncbi:hypothetical protein [Mesorhizobium sp. M0491]|uniref:hypothetical protein n=1 Tax=Mesorhizobium sp. M0491 TaxID=2956950 RepID=UPI003339206C
MLTIQRHEDDAHAYLDYARLSSVPVSDAWTSTPAVENRVHRIHAYPAKFPAFMISAALAYAQSEGVEVCRVADVFCGCGTVAYEAAARGLEFWGCDINPVATLIAEVKAFKIDVVLFEAHVASVASRFDDASSSPAISTQAIDRLLPWYDALQFDDLAKLLNAINLERCASADYRQALLCAFSAIVKPSSRWKSRSIKPAKDFHRTPDKVLSAFLRQCRFMSRAWPPDGDDSHRKPRIEMGNVTMIEGPDVPVDLMLTSPPYVTSYEYPDLHQLSALWLGFTGDHRTLRKGVIGTGYRRADLGSALRHLNPVATRVVFSLFDKDRSMAEAVAAYFLDMQLVARRCYQFIRSGGIGIFVIGDTKLQGVGIDNANHLVESLLDAGFDKIRVVRRTTKNKANTPFRMPDGKFSGSPTSISIYGDEYILMAHRP